jgi:hypothetical protein
MKRRIMHRCAPLGGSVQFGFQNHAISIELAVAPL